MKTAFSGPKLVSLENWGGLDSQFDILVIKCYIVKIVLMNSVRGLFFFQGPIGREIRTTVRLRWSFAQMGCAMSLVCPPIATHRTCQLWARSEPVNIPKTIKSYAKCGVRAVIRFLYSEQATRNVFLRYCPSSGNARPHTAAATKRLLKRFRWEVFDHPPSSAWTWLPVIFISCLVWNGRRRTKFWHRQWATDLRRELAESTGWWLLWRGYWKVGTTLRKMSTSERRLYIEVAGRCS